MNSADQRAAVLKEFASLGPKIDRLNAKRSELYALQEALVLKGDALGISATDMARARKPQNEVKYQSEYYRQIIREHRGPKTRRKKVAQSG